MRAPYLADPDVTLHHGDVLDVLRELPAESVDCCLTSPPYYGLRDYGVDGQIGLESTPAEFVARLVEVFREVRRVLAPHGTCWVNLGDSYAMSTRGAGGEGKQHTNAGSVMADRSWQVAQGFKPKDLLGIPWRVALALQDDGWWLRSDVVWAKPNPMPESVTDRPTRAHEYVFMLSKAPRYYFDQEAGREAREPDSLERSERYGGNPSHSTKNQNPDRNDNDRFGSMGVGGNPAGRNMRSVWTIATQPYAEAHFATFPERLVERVLAVACPERVCGECGAPSVRVVEAEAPDGRRAVMRGGKAYDAEGRPLMGDNMIDRAARGSWNSGGATLTRATTGWTDCGHGAYRPGIVLDPFSGSGTTAHVARRMGRRAVGIDLSAEYLAMAARRLRQLSLLG